MQSHLTYQVWASQVAHATRIEKALLPKSESELLAQMDKGLSVIRKFEHIITAHATLWLLRDDWYELGTVWVHPEFRSRDLSAELYQDLFARHPHRNIIATTTNPASLKIGLRVGMVCIPYASLPPDIWQATCCCPVNKTGSEDNVAACKLRERSCFVRVTRDTWHRLGSPSRIDVTPFARRPPSP